MVKVSPSVLSADFGRLNEDIKELEKGGADFIHLDVMDGMYVPNISFGAPIIKSIRPVTDIPFDVHLMVEAPERYIKDFVDAGADMITVHQEASLHLHRTIELIKSYGLKAGVALNPATPIGTLEHIIDDLDLVLVMTVNPGFGGQSFIPAMKDKIRDLKKLIDERELDTLIEVDGGVKLDNAKEIVACGVDSIVVGSGIFKHEDIAEKTKEFKNI